MIMDPFIVGIFIFTVVCVSLAILDSTSKKNSFKAGRIDSKPEDQNLKYLQEVERYKFWRDNGQRSSNKKS